MTIAVEFYERDFSAALNFPGVLITVERYGYRDEGGCDLAVARAQGTEEALWSLLNWLRAPVILRDALGNDVWRGYVSEVTVRVGAIEIGVSLETMFNRVNVVYCLVEPGSATVGTRASTGFSQDDASVSAYGTRELQYSSGEETIESAVFTRDTVLSELYLPRPHLTPGFGMGDLVATLTLRGWWYTLGWMYFSRDTGREEHPSGGSYQTLGLGFTSSQVGFVASAKFLSDIGARCENLVKDIVFVVSGSTANDGTFTVDSGTSREEAVVYGPAMTLAFVSATQRITDSGLGLGVFDANDVLQVSGSAANDGYYLVASVAGDGSYVTTVQALTNESTGASVTLTTGNRIKTVEALADELPGASVTVTTYGQQIAQSFQLGGSEAWYAYSVWVSLRSVGFPTDNLLIRLYADSGGVPGALLATSETVSGSSLSTQATLTKFTLTTPYALALSTTYWIVVARDGGDDAHNYYELEVDEDLGYSRGSLLLWNGSAWVARPIAADLLFKVGGVEETTLQIERIVSDEGQFLEGTVISDDSGVYTSPYRDGDSYALSEIESLLKRGTTNGRRLLAEITPERELRVYEEPAMSSSNVELYLDMAGRLYDVWGNLWPGHLAPVGRWCQLRDWPETINLGFLADPSTFLIASAEYDVALGAWVNITPRGQDGPFALPVIAEG